jgi:hypothetical protein
MGIVYIFGWEKEYKDLKLFRRAVLDFFNDRWISILSPFKITKRRSWV